MDSRGNGPHPFARPLSQPAARDPRHAPIPPPPYTLQAPMSRPQPSYNDPFIPRRNGREEGPREMTRSQPPFGISTYAANLPREAVGSVVDAPDRRPEGTSSWSRFGDGLLDRYRSHQIDGSTNSALPPPPPSSTTFRAPLQAPILSSDVTRQPGQRTSSPRMYGTTQDHLPPPPPPFGARPMLPPSSPQYSAQAPASRAPPPPNPLAGGRDLSMASSNNRHGSSMSISSMLDSDPGRPLREPNLTKYTNGSSRAPFPPPTQHSSSASSPTRPSHLNGLQNHEALDTSRISNVPTNRPFRAFSGGTTLYSPIKAGSPETFKYGPLSAKSGSQYSPRLETGAGRDWEQQHHRYASTGRLIDRPTSQPSGQNNSLIDVAKRSISSKGSFMDDQQAKLGFNGFTRNDSEQLTKDRSSSFNSQGNQNQVDPQNGSLQTQNKSTHVSPREDQIPTSTYSFLTHSSVFSEPPTSNKFSRPESISASTLTLDHDQRSYANTHKGPFNTEELDRLREERLIRQNSVYSPTRFQSGNLDERRMQYSLSAPGGDAPVNSDGIIQQMGNRQDLNNHRASLGLLLDHNKRAGRVSPMPQAVQGAQARTSGPSDAPNIKNEFRSIFPGLGSGVSSTGLAGSGASTPFPPSPRQNTENGQRLPFAARHDLMDFSKSRSTSRVSKRSKRVIDDDSVELENGEVAGGPPGPKATKRSKHLVHHHHASGHHHHHHREDQGGTNLRVASNPNSTSLIHHHHHQTPVKHHHHTDGSIHYRKAPALPKAPRIPNTTINNTEIIQKVQHVPRHHLGSTLYSPNLELPTSQASLDSRLAFSTGQYFIPRHEGKENCTLTVRIPRFYLTAEEREQVCQRRAVWGTDIYTDDSDPLAAAIHAGWVRGDWGADIDYSMIELDVSNNDDASAQTTLKALPPSPMLPPPHSDLHITLLILPTLQKYASRVAHGIKSRAWDDTHDGMSYRIEKIAWVNERSGRGQERGAEAKRRRITALISRRDAGPPLRLGIGKKVGAPKVIRAVA